MSARIPLHVLVVEDSDDGCTLLVRKLQHGGYEVTHRRVDSALELGAALDLDHWDLVISDYSMPGFNGLQALKLVQEHGLDVPFILVSGAIGEDVAVEAMNAGAHDYVLKDNLARLIPAVTRELREAQMRHQRASAEQKLREHEESIRESEGRFRQLAESINEVFWIISADGQKMIYISAPYEEIWGRPCHELYANPRAWLQGVHPDDRERLEKAVFTQNGMAERIDEEYRIVRPDETVRWVSARGFPVRNEEGRVYRVAGVCEDITDRRCAQATLLEHQQELERKNHRLAELYQTAQKFVDDVSHEFRTPLTVIKGFAEAINEGLSGPINPQQGEFLELILDRSRDLAQMVDDLLDSSKLRAGTVRIDRRPHHVKQILSTIWPMVMAKAAANKIDLIDDLAEDLPDVFVDAEKVGRIIVNLAVNAIKFSREGGRVTISGRLGMDGGVEIGVTDQGPGIAPENLEIIFQRFKQVGNAQGSATKGFGLGLNIARELVALNLGEISVSSDIGHGSTFSFTLPPNDPTAILKRYLSYLKTLDANDSCIALLRATTDVEAPMRDELRGMLCSIVRPSELVLVGPGNESLLVLGCTGNADRWLQRLRQTTAEWHTQEPRQITAAPLRWEEAARWAYPADTEQVMAHVLESLSMETVLV